MRSARRPVTHASGASTRRRLSKAAAGAPSPALVPHERFAERLRAIEREVERAYAASGGRDAAGSLLADAAEAVLAGYARIARDLERGSLLTGVRSWIGLGAANDAAGATEAGAAHDAPTDDLLLRPLLRALYQYWWRVDVTGLEHVPQTGPVLLVANHAGGLFPHDAAMLATALAERRAAPRDVRALLDDPFCDLPLVGDLARRIGGVRARPEEAERLLATGRAVIAFPEGIAGIAKPYARRYRVQRFARTSFVGAALRAGVPVLPVAIIGAEEAHPVLARWDALGKRIGLPYLPLTPTFPWFGLFGLVPLPSKWRIEIGAPVEWPRRAGRALADRALVARRNEDLRQRVQRMVAEALERRGHAFL